MKFLGTNQTHGLGLEAMEIESSKQYERVEDLRERGRQEINARCQWVSISTSPGGKGVREFVF